MEMLDVHFLNNALERSRYYKSLAENAIMQLSDNELHFRFNKNDNNISTVAKHIAGNLLSRWTDFANSDGEKAWRNRDTEFIDDIRNKESLLSLWEHGWDCFLSELQQIAPQDLTLNVLIRKETHSILQAIQRQLNHNSYHIGQIVFLAKSIKGSDWISLSIPKNKSKEFNKNMGL
jgi:uncharacterized damage-inducible protein DinB